MSDIGERLRAEGKDAFAKHYSLGMWKLCAEAADEIDRIRSFLKDLRAENAALSGSEELLDEMHTQRDILVNALEDLYAWCCGLNNFCPDSRIGRAARDALAKATASSDPSQSEEPSPQSDPATAQ